MKNKLPIFLSVLVFCYACNQKQKNYDSKTNTKAKEAIKITELQTKKEAATTTPFHEKVTLAEKYPIKKKDRSVDKTPDEKNVFLQKEAFIYPNFSKWDSTFSNSEEWMNLFENSKIYFLKGLQNNLDSHSNYKLSEAIIINSYQEKMSNLFYQSPEFVQFCTIKFKKSLEFQNFIDRNKSRMKGLN